MSCGSILLPTLIVLVLVLVIVLLILLLKRILSRPTFKYTIPSPTNPDYLIIEPEWDRLDPKYGGKEMYEKMMPYLPEIQKTRWDGDVKVYIPYMNDCQGSDVRAPDEEEKAHYFTWVSAYYKQPIFSGFVADCLNPGTCSTQIKRADLQFSYCCLDDVDTQNYVETNWDRGHMVNSSAISLIYGSGVSTFNMCNVSPQTKLLNQFMWNDLETMINTKLKDSYFIVFQGALFNDANTCLKETIPVTPCTGGPGEIPIPYAFWKMVISTKDQLQTWVWFFETPQTTGDPSVSPFNNKGKKSKIKPSYYAGKDGLDRVEREGGYVFPDLLKAPGVIQDNDHKFSIVATGMSDNNRQLAINLSTYNLVDLNNPYNVLYTPDDSFDYENAFSSSNGWKSTLTNAKITGNKLSSVSKQLNLYK